MLISQINQDTSESLFLFKLIENTLCLLPLGLLIADRKRSPYSRNGADSLYPSRPIFQYTKCFQNNEQSPAYGTYSDKSPNGPNARKLHPFGNS